RLPALAAGQKAAAVNLGIFPDGDSAYASASPPQPSASIALVNNDRLGGIDAFLRPAPAPAQTAPAQPAVRLASAPQPVPATVQRTVAMFQPKLWLQLSSAQDADALASRFKRYKSQNPDLFSGIKPYVARTASGARLLVGPFRGASDAAIFAEDLQTIGINANNFTDSPADRIAPLLVE
ncbi:MAG TPA: hypothetical protein VF750_03890, partial [Sphingomicrobium sp.]